MSQAKKTSAKKAKAAGAAEATKKADQKRMNDKTVTDSSAKDASASCESGDTGVNDTSVNNTSVNAIRAGFLDFFARNDHQVLPSSPLVPRHDPTLMFTNAGMVQFKNVLTGAEKPAFPRVATAQKCVRAGGKHNDLDNVGYTARHHTFFEMLGNFSFGDYFKERAILLAWELLTKDYALDKKRLLITVYADDDEAARLWRKISGFPDEKIIRIAGADNFWSMGELGPCGPSSEIFYDHGPSVKGGPPGSPDAEGDRFVEIWNLVFMQYEQLAADKRVDLPQPSIDTGMGLERLAAVLQGTHDNYEIDLFKALIAASVSLTGVPAKGEAKPSHRVIADHLRASSFLIADGVLPSNEGRGYVLRRIMRRAMRHAHLLGAEEPLLWRLVPTLITEMGHAYPELERGSSLIVETLKLEETRFRDTLGRGLRLLDEATRGLKRGAMLPGETAFKLYDTYGFPFDLTEDALKARGIGVDTKGFAAAMERQRAEARKSWAGSGEAATETLWFELKEEVGATEFLGYDAEASSGEIVALVKDGKRVSELKAGDARHRHRQSDPVLWRVRRPGRRPRADRKPVRRALSGRGHAEEAAWPVPAFRQPRSWNLEGRRGGRSCGRSCPPHRNARQSFRHPPLARGAARSAWAARGAEGLAGRAGAAPLRFLPSAADDASRDRGGGRSCQHHGAAELRRGDASDGPRRGDRQGRACAVR